MLDHIREYHKKYYEDHKERYSQYAKQKYNDSPMLTCDCGVVVKLCYYGKHQKTKKHMDYVNKLTNQ